MFRKKRAPKMMHAFFLLFDEKKIVKSNQSVPRITFAFDILFLYNPVSRIFSLLLKK